MIICDIMEISYLLVLKNAKECQKLNVKNHDAYIETKML